MVDFVVSVLVSLVYGSIWRKSNKRQIPNTNVGEMMQEAKFSAAGERQRMTDKEG
jgi:hypothetical protein